MNEDLEQIAREIVWGETARKWRNGDCSDETFIDVILQALRDVREADAKVMKVYFDKLPLWEDADKYHLGRHVEPITAAIMNQGVK